MTQDHRAVVDAMRQAIGLSRRALGWTSPNPIVGCVVLDRTGSVAGTGYHRGAGRPHAEVLALAEAGRRAEGGTALVTLEPCAHTGRTGPCALALREAGVARVVYAVPDPNPTAAGGAAYLRAAGIEVIGDVLRMEAEHANRMWLTAVRRRRPFVTWNFTGATDERRPAAEYALRGTHDAVLVGADTIRADDPQMGLPAGMSGRPPIRVVLMSGKRLPQQARVLDDSAPTLVAVDEADQAAMLPGAEVMSPHGTGLSPMTLLSELYARGVRSVLMEGGGGLAPSFALAGLVDRTVGRLDRA
ncbi:MAG TPA: bifunctional diaminohydroxyphosphoribosylaminopyrimidine deaminase/5-amino-6-(5-phosphoribosylamino)uracil reductase RibD [Pseudonocardiaceae bacterium]|jgi:diaminohydroxyphosphoribosylaminopyrimidine deaminase/5-amino-6-(5-phosphoribosylamino)uracil reductase|nr:bifunctional diaminohydroxyphosphoribosylaminopyrimidine deaminase/5-amino-6-(5-phosphoribosylamino)uracil reductase RibD [Pseudonocardiaceae bacterium]